MSLFGPVYVILSLSKTQEMWLRDLSTNAGLVGEHTHGMQIALEALVAKFDQASAGDLTPEQEAQVRDLIAQLKASQTALSAAEAANPPEGGSAAPSS